MNEQENLSLLAQLIKLARVDQKISKEEYQFLKKISELLDIDETNFKHLLEKEIVFQAPESEMDRILQFQRLIMVANVDMNVTENELDYLRKAGIRLGLNPESIEVSFREMKKNKWGMIEPKKFIQIFKLHHN